MALQISPRDTDLLLSQKNILSEEVLFKYNQAGEIVEKCLTYLVSLINDSYHLSNDSYVYSVAELSILGDSYMKTLINELNLEDIVEKGIAFPVCFNINDVVSNYSPDFNTDETNLVYFKEGDLVKIHLGCQIDGYTVSKCHTMVIYPKSENGVKSGPLLGENANSVIANYFATESITTLLALSNNPERLPDHISTNKVINGSLIRSLVDEIVASFNCKVLPGSKIRRIRRFLSGQSEGVVAERDFKGVVWSEKDQEDEFLRGVETGTQLTVIDKSLGRFSSSSAIPTDDFIVLPGEVYNIDLRIVPLDTQDVGIFTLDTMDGDDSNIFIRDISMNEQLKLRNSRRLLTLVDKNQSVYPFKLSYLSENFPLNNSKDIKEQLNNIKKDYKIFKFGLNECLNKQLFVKRPIVKSKFIKLRDILNLVTATGINGYDATNPTLPGLELPLPKLGVSQLKLKNLLKKAKNVSNSREVLTIAIDKENSKTVVLGGKNKPEFVHSDLQLSGSLLAKINALSELASDSRFGVTIV